MVKFYHFKVLLLNQVFQITAALARQKPQNQNIPELGIGAHGVIALNPEELFPSRDLGKVAGHFSHGRSSATINEYGALPHGLD